MSNRKDTDREIMIDGCERLYILGYRKPYHVQKVLGIGDFKTADNYLKVAARRVHRRYRKIDKDNLRRQQLTVIEQALKECWANMLGASNTNERVGAINAASKLLKQQAELLGLEAPRELNVGSKKGDTLIELLAKLPDDEARKIIDRLDEVRGE